MLTKRIIPCLDFINGRVVKGTSFNNLKDAGDPVELADFYYREGADELVFLDIGATPEGRNTVKNVVKAVAKKVFIPLTVGGGLRSIDDMGAVLEAGADKISVNTAAVLRPEIIGEGAMKFGSQCIVLAIDAMRDASSSSPKWVVCTHGGKKRTNIDAVIWAKQAVNAGAGEILLTSWDSDGKQLGYDIELTKSISEAVNVPVIASGGAGKLEHIYEVIIYGQADAVLAASIFHYKTYSIKEVKEYLKQKGIPVRLN